MIDFEMTFPSSDWKLSGRQLWSLLYNMAVNFNNNPTDIYCTGHRMGFGSGKENKFAPASVELQSNVDKGGHEADSSRRSKQ